MPPITKDNAQLGADLWDPVHEVRLTLVGFDEYPDGHDRIKKVIVRLHDLEQAKGPYKYGAYVSVYPEEVVRYDARQIYLPQYVGVNGWERDLEDVVDRHREYVSRDYVLGAGDRLRDYILALETKVVNLAEA